MKKQKDKNMKRILSLSLVLLLFCGRAASDNLTGITIGIEPGKSDTLSVVLSNPDAQYAGFQFILELPEGVTPAKSEYDSFLIEKGSRLEALDINIGMQELGNNRYQVLAYQFVTTAFPETDGDVAQIVLQADAELSPNMTMNGKFTEIQMAKTDAESCDLSDATFSIYIGKLEDDIENIAATGAENPVVYNTAGIRLSQKQRGLNIIRYSDGTVRKVMRK